MTSIEAQMTTGTRAWSESPAVRTLHSMASVDRYNEWIYAKLAPFVGDQVLEVGCGIGNMTPYFLGAKRLTCIDLLPESVAMLQESLKEHDRAEAMVADIVDPVAVRHLGQASYDTVACINVLEHIEADRRALCHMHDLLIPGGKLLLFVPAGTYLYGHLDRELGHHRRYSLEALSEIAMMAGFEQIASFHMNAAAIPGWFISSRLLRRESPPGKLLRLFNLLTPVFMWIEDRVRIPIGQSIVYVGRRPE